MVSEPAALPARTTRLGSYEVLRSLAKGGMAELFLARSVGPQGFEKLVVLKKVLPHLADSPRFIQLFLDEAKLVAGLEHPHIVHTHDMGLVDGQYFFTMEYIHGEDLRTILKRSQQLGRSVPIEHAIQVARAVAGALHYAHERCAPDGTSLQIVHRDVSPANVLVSYDGAIKLVDFGVAKAATSSIRTRTGTLKGKVAYMSPEQARGAAIDRRTDIFSLGIVMWELVTGQRLYRADNDLATIQRILHEPIPPASSLRPECPPDLARVLDKALAKDPAARYQTAEELLIDLDELVRRGGIAQSSVALGRHVRELFAREVDAWQTARADGATLADHVLTATGDPDLADSDPEVEVEHPDDDEAPSIAPATAVTIPSGHRRKKRSLRWLALAVATVVMAGASVAIVSFSTGSTSDPEPAPAASVTPPVAAPAAPSPVTPKPATAPAEASAVVEQAPAAPHRSSPAPSRPPPRRASRPKPTPVASTAAPAPAPVAPQPAPPQLAPPQPASPQPKPFDPNAMLPPP